jgi:hypothetical protein
MELIQGTQHLPAALVSDPFLFLEPRVSSLQPRSARNITYRVLNFPRLCVLDTKMSETDESAAPQITTVSDASSLKALNRGPITTLFRPPSSCTATLTTQQPGYDSLLFFGHWHDPYFEASCVPLGTMKAGEIVEDPWNNYYCACIADVSRIPLTFCETDSPAICPQGWSTVTTFKSTIPGGIGTEVYSLGTETTAALCCPS